MRSTLSPLGDLSLPMMPDAAAWVKGSIERHMKRYYDSKRNVTCSVGKVLEEKLALAEQDPEDYPTACQQAGVLVDEHDSISISEVDEILAKLAESEKARGETCGTRDEIHVLLWNRHHGKKEYP